MPFLRASSVRLSTEPSPFATVPRSRWAWLDGHPMGRRPRTWFGPEDHDGESDPQDAALERWVEQHLWDVVFRGLPRLQRWACAWRGQITEPVGHHGRPSA